MFINFKSAWTIKINNLYKIKKLNFKLLKKILNYVIKILDRTKDL